MTKQIDITEDDFSVGFHKSNLSDADIRLFAKEVYEESLWDYLLDGVTDETVIATQHGFQVRSGKPGDDIDSIIRINEHKSIFQEQKTHRLIGYSESISLEARRNVIAHMLGHYFLHAKEEDYVKANLYKHGSAKYERIRENKDEWEKYLQAALFARVLLIPEDIFVSELDKKLDKKRELYLSDYYRSIEEISKRFFVPNKIVAQRMLDNDKNIMSLKSQYKDIEPVAIGYMKAIDMLENSRTK